MITDELRKYVQSWRETPNLMDDLDAGDIDGLLGDFEHIADRIDAKHEEALGSKVARAISVGEDGTEFVSMPAKELSECYIELPKDADGECIHIGDVMDSKVDYLFDGKPFMVRAMVLYEDGWEAADSRFGNRYKPDSLHHHKPTVEDVLEKALNEAAMLDRPEGYWPSAADITNIVNSLAAKLQLKEDE